MAAEPLAEYTPETLRAASREEGRVVMAIKGRVYDLEKFVHPGGMPILKQWRGRDATKPFMRAHPWINMDSVDEFVIGRLVDTPKVLKGGAADEAKQMRGLMDSVGLGSEMSQLSDREIAAALATASRPPPPSAGPQPSEDDVAESDIAEVFNTLCDASAQVVRPDALRTFLARLEAPAQLIEQAVARGAMDRRAFVNFVKTLDF
eukprot:TRINITY_DN32050_c0_g1_i1.p1 TRINITY_DN32050_c0_g1~~TRINITY_DN32050_c0_g1_i1.p1  ORF type:complete len:237 (+),score=52.64 TRINITY_DN32050_c0_g1_i1:98-712(+)